MAGSWAKELRVTTSSNRGNITQALGHLPQLAEEFKRPMPGLVREFRLRGRGLDLIAIIEAIPVEPKLQFDSQ